LIHLDFVKIYKLKVIEAFGWALGTLGAEDPCCPIASLEVPRKKATEAYEAFQCLDHFKV